MSNPAAKGSSASSSPKPNPVVAAPPAKPSAPIPPAVSAKSATSATAAAVATATAGSRKRPPPTSEAPNPTGDGAGANRSTGNKPHKKRPYRRTKRPKDYNDKSTITTATESMTQQNAYDAVLAGSQDLWQAAAEAQQLGRLKMASAYMLLLHARLVGLGKRFDRARRHQKKEEPVEQQETPSETTAAAEIVTTANASEKVVPGSPTKEGKETKSVANAKAGRTSSPSNTPLPPTTATATRQPEKASTPPAATTTNNRTAKISSTPKTQAAQKLARMLPQDIAFDAAMMEHLAKAAAELHAARSRRHHYHNCASTAQSHGGGSSGGGGKHPHALLASPDAREFLASTANSQGVTNAATAVAAWSRKEVDCIDLALYKGQTTREITTSLPGRTEQQVKAFIRNRKERARVAADVELPVAATAAAGGADDEEDATGGGELPKKTSKINRGGKGRKPVTTAMNTVPNANCDARALLQGGLLEKMDGNDDGDDEEQERD